MCITAAKSLSLCHLDTLLQNIKILFSSGPSIPESSPSLFASGSVPNSPRCFCSLRCRLWLRFSVFCSALSSFLEIFLSALLAISCAECWSFLSAVKSALSPACDPFCFELVRELVMDVPCRGLMVASSGAAVEASCGSGKDIIHMPCRVSDTALHVQQVTCDLIEPSIKRCSNRGPWALLSACMQSAVSALILHCALTARLSCCTA
jgi:hypothetical protein